MEPPSFDIDLTTDREIKEIIWWRIGLIEEIETVIWWGDDGSGGGRGGEGGFVGWRVIKEVEGRY